MNRYYMFVFVFLLTALGLCSIQLAADDTDLMRQAEAFYDVQEYSQARGIYQNILQESLQPWQRAIILYNIGTVFLADKQWDQAISTLQSVPVSDNPSPLLYYQVLHNLILAYIGKAQSQTLSNNPSQASDLFKKALDLFPPAEEAHCTVQKLKGYETCIQLNDLRTLHDYIKQQLAFMLKKQESDAILQTSFQDGLTWLLSAINNMSSHLDFISQPQLKGELKQHYLDLFIEEDKEWLPFWEALKKKIPEADKKRRTELFLSAENHFSEALSHFEIERLEESKKELEASSEDIKALLAMPPPPSPAQPPPPQQQPPELPPQTAPPPKPEAKTDEQLIRLLLEMEQADNIQAPEQQPLQQKVLRPW